MDLFSQSISFLEKSMDTRMDSQRVIAANLANVDTPGFTAQKVDFQATMDQAIAGLDKPTVVEASTAPAFALDGNNVDMEEEMSSLQQNKLLYSVTSQILGAKFRQLNTAITAEG